MKKILLAIDGSPQAQAAAEFLAHLPHDETLELIVLSVSFVPGTPKHTTVGDWVDTCLQQERDRNERSYAAICEIFAGADVKLRHMVRHGHPGENIVMVAKELDVDWIVLGATGHSAIARMLLGSTSDFVATHAPCSVLVYRPCDAADTKRSLRIAIGYEDSEPSEAAIEEFSEFKWGKETQVKLVSIVSLPGLSDLLHPDQSLVDFVEDAADQICRVAPNVEACVIQHKHAGEGLVKFVDDQQIDLLVVGESHRTRLGRMLLGSLTRFVLRHATCSVWITRNRAVKHPSKHQVAKKWSVSR